MKFVLLNTNYDEALLKIEHYNLHPEYLPFIGKHYDLSKILLVGESHYINNASEFSEGSDCIEDCFTSWYDKTTCDFMRTAPSAVKECYTWFNTRGVLENFCFHNRSKAKLNVSKTYEGNRTRLCIELNRNRQDDAFCFLQLFSTPCFASWRKYCFIKS